MKVWVVLAGVLAAGTGASGGGRPAAPSDDARALFGLAGVRGEFEGAGLQAAQSLGDYSLTPGQRRVLEEALARVFEPGRLEEEALRQFRGGTSEALVKRAVVYFGQDPVGIQVAELERLARTPESLALLTAFAERVHSTIQDPRRIELARRMDKALGATEHATAVWLASAKAVAMGVDAMSPLDRQLGAQAISRHYAAYRTKMRAGVAQSVLARCLFTYRALDVEAWERHVRFLEERGPQGLYRRVGRTVEVSLETVSREVGSHVVTRLQRRPEVRTLGSAGDQAAATGRKTEGATAREHRPRLRNSR